LIDYLISKNASVSFFDLMHYCLSLFKRKTPISNSSWGFEENFSSERHKSISDARSCFLENKARNSFQESCWCRSPACWTISFQF